MSGDIEFGNCDICHQETNLQRSYFRYDIKCECHSPNHFEFVLHCKDCKAVEPKETKVLLKTNSLKKTLNHYQTKRTEIISEMLDNPDEHGIYPTSVCFDKLDDLFKELLN